MGYTQTNSLYMRCRQGILLGCFAGFLALPVTRMQAQQPAIQGAVAATQPSTPLVADSCPVVVRGANISLDWNPGFEHEGVVTGLRIFRVTFVPLASNGALGTRWPLVLGGRAGDFTASTAVNGYFDIGFRVPRNITPGEYHLIKAEGMAKTLAEYTGAGIRMTNSPASQNFCFKVL